MSVRVATFLVGIIGNDAYLVYGAGKEAVLIDAAGGYGEIKKEAERLGKTVTVVLLTHGHWDHIVDAEKWRRDGAKIYIAKEDASMLTGEGSLASFFMRKVEASMADVLLSDGDIVSVGEMAFKVIVTPGHSRGSVTFQIEDKLFTGDTLFAGDFGRYDLPGGDFNTLKQSIAKLFSLPGDYIIYPGHEESSTLQKEREENSILRVFRGEF